VKQAPRDFWLSELNRLLRDPSTDQAYCDRLEVRIKELEKLIGPNGPGTASRGAH
jgi:hypothetical protein